MIEQRTITTGPGLTFDVLTAGPPNAPLVLLLHGFAESFHTWRSQVVALAAAGYRAVAPHQRGYSPDARPDTADASNYEFDKLIGDAMDIAAACGQANRRFHLVGRAAAEGTAGDVSGPYRFEVLPGVGHFAVDQAPEQVNALLLAHLKTHPA